MKDFIFKRISFLFPGTAGFLVVLFIWSILARKTGSFLLPAPAETLLALKELIISGALGRNLLITLTRTLMGYGLALLAGVLVALGLNASRIMRRGIRPLITVIQTTPPVIWIALAVIWFGVAEDLTPIFLIFVVTFPVIFINVDAGLQDIDEKLLEMARVYSWSGQEIFFHIYFPSLIPYLASGFSTGFAFAWKSTIFAEFIGSSTGVGYALSMANSNLDTPGLFAWAVVLVVLMLVIEYMLIKPLQKRATGWKKR